MELMKIVYGAVMMMIMMDIERVLTQHMVWNVMLEMHYIMNLNV